MLKRVGIAVLIGVIAISMLACGNNNEPEAGTNNGANNNTNTGTNNGNVTAIDVQSVYKTSCISCHGTDLKGGMGPNLQKVGAEMSKDEIAAQISNGGKGMPAFKGMLGDEEINALADWLAAQK